MQPVLGFSVTYVLRTWRSSGRVQIMEKRKFMNHYTAGKI